jgi:hypothetical protein
MIIRTISKQHTGGAMERKDQPEWMTNGRSAALHSILLNMGSLDTVECVSCVPLMRAREETLWREHPDSRASAKRDVFTIEDDAIHKQLEAEVPIPPPHYVKLNVANEASAAAAERESRMPVEWYFVGSSALVSIYLAREEAINGIN